MSRARLLPALVLSLLLIGSGTALGAWTTSGTGSATGRGGTMGTATVTLGTVTCTTSGGTTTATLPVSWTGVDGAVQYVVEASALSSFALFTNSQTVTTRSTTVSATVQGYTAYVRVRALAGKWTGPNSATVSKAIAC